MGSLFNIYKDIFPTLGMYSGLKACHEKNNLPFDINTEIETIQKQINYDINHLNDGLIKRVLNLFIHLISNPDNLELTLNRYSSTTEQIIGRTKRNGLHEFDDGDLKIIFNRQDDNESVLTVKDKDKDKDKDISHHCNVKTEQLQQFIKIMEQKAQLPIYIDKNNLKESIFSVLHNDPQQVDKDQHLPCEKFLKHACKSSNSFEVKLDATHQYQHLNNFMISFDPVENNDFRKVRHLTYVNFKNANLRNSNFNGKVLTGVTFTGSDLSNAYLEHIDFTTVILYETSKIPGIPGTPQIPGTPKVILTGAILNYSDLSGKDLSEYNLTGILCMYTNFSNANLTNCKISNANFSNAKFYNTNCTGANCSNILFDYAWFDNTIFIKTLFKNTCFYNVRAKNVYLEGAYLNNDNIVNQANNSTEKQSIDSTDKQANDSTVQQSIDSTVQQANDSTDKQANDNIDKQVNDSTDKQAKNSTEQQDSNSFNQARLKKEVNRRFSIPGLTSYQPTYIVEE
ncbi:pentapeptide repeat-containing protein [Escherichia coli]